MRSLARTNEMLFKLMRMCVRCQAMRQVSISTRHSTETGQASVDFDDHESSISPEEVKKFGNLSGEWWDIKGKFVALHSMNQVRVPFIRDCLMYEGYGNGRPLTSNPLKRIDILDVGCGGGVLSEPLARLGANVVGIDASEEAVEVAKRHKPTNIDNLQYLTALAEDLASVGTLKFDAVVASEVIEHVTDPLSFSQTCASLLKPKGSIIISTINRTLLSKAFAVIVAESILGLAPPETHDWKKFITTDELTHYLQQSDCVLRKLHGMNYNPFCNRWSFTANTDVNYIIHATKDTVSA